MAYHRIDNLQPILTIYRKHSVIEEDFLSVKEFATLVHLHYNTIMRAIKSGRLNAFRIGSGKRSSYRIARTEIHRIALMDMEDLVEKIIEKKLRNP